MSSTLTLKEEHEEFDVILRRGGKNKKDVGKQHISDKCHLSKLQSFSSWTEKERVLTSSGSRPTAFSTELDAEAGCNTEIMKTTELWPSNSQRSLTVRYPHAPPLPSQTHTLHFTTLQLKPLKASPSSYSKQHYAKATFEHCSKRKTSTPNQ